MKASELVNDLEMLIRNFGDQDIHLQIDPEGNGYDTVRGVCAGMFMDREEYHDEDGWQDFLDSYYDEDDEKPEFKINSFLVWP